MSIKDIFSPKKILEKLKQYRRVINVATKPDKDEFVSSAKITGSGILLVGLIGFMIFLGYQLIIMLI